jgi:hypothetical protein
MFEFCQQKQQNARFLFLLVLSCTTYVSSEADVNMFLFDLQFVCVKVWDQSHLLEVPAVDLS